MTVVKKKAVTKKKAAVKKKAAIKKVAVKKRARKKDGTFLADNPATPQNEAWIEEAPQIKLPNDNRKPDIEKYEDGFVMTIIIAAAAAAVALALWVVNA